MIEQACPIVASTPDDAEHFFGFHDLCPWNEADDTLVLLRRPHGQQRGRAEVCLWTPDDGVVRVLDETDAWNWQQGARAQWLPGRRDSLVYNVLQQGRPRAVICDVRSGEVEPLADSVYDIDATGTSALSVNFARLGRYWSAYGYLAEGDADIDEPAPDNDGIWRLDLKTGERRLLVSIAAVAGMSGTSGGGRPHFLAHPTFNPGGSHFCFMDRFIAADGALYSRLFVADRDGGDCRPIAEEKVSHFDWYDDDTLLVWARRLPTALTAVRRRGWTRWPLLRAGVGVLRALRPTTKQRWFGEAYVWLSREGRVIGTLGRGQLEQDGHPSFLAGTRWLVTDTYPDRSDGNRQRLILYDLEAERRIDVAALPAVEPYLHDAIGDKCDLHPRWNRAGTRICVDSSHSGTRQVHILDISSVVEAVGAAVGTAAAPSHSCSFPASLAGS